MAIGGGKKTRRKSVGPITARLILFPLTPDKFADPMRFR